MFSDWMCVVPAYAESRMHAFSHTVPASANANLLLILCRAYAAPSLPRPTSPLQR